MISWYQSPEGRPWYWSFTVLSTMEFLMLLVCGSSLSIQLELTISKQTFPITMKLWEVIQNFSVMGQCPQLCNATCCTTSVCPQGGAITNWVFSLVFKGTQPRALLFAGAPCSLFPGSLTSFYSTTPKEKNKSLMLWTSRPGFEKGYTGREHRQRHWSCHMGPIFYLLFFYFTFI